MRLRPPVQSLRPDTISPAPTATIASPPAPPTSSSRRGERANQARNPPAASAQIESETIAIAAKIRPRSRI